ncbi:MAG: hypothetical protein Q8K89_11195, partial [Actinomycetota bacterium]|nr:hypothetical protein [Actinomycetota bacterium]
EHNLSTSAKTTNPTNVCLNCHNNAASTTAIQSNWSTKDTVTACSTCHTGALTIHTDTNSTAHSDVLSAGCSSSGIGCHNTADLSQVGVTNVVNTNIHSTCLRCHDRTATAPNLAYNPANDTCGSGAECHATAGQYNTTTAVHNGSGGLADGDDAAHHTATGMTVKVGAYVNKNACSDCHSATLKTSHATSSVGAVSCSTGGTGSLGCHNSTAVGAASTQVKAGWTNDTCADCHTTSHNTYTLATHTALVGTAGTADNCVTGGCHLAGATSDVRLIHDRVTSGCSAIGQDSLNGNGAANAACHALNKSKVAGTIGCGSGTTGATKCHVNHTNSNHGYNAPMHTATDANAVECLGCHQQTDLFALHKNSCATCHSNAKYSAYNGGDLGKSATYGRTFPTNGCLACHIVPPMAHTYTGHTSASGHYVSAATTHTASAAQMSTNLTGTVLSEKGSAWTAPTSGIVYSFSCQSCHVSGLMEEHAMTGATFSNVPTGTRVTDKCTGCHNATNFATNKAAWTSTKLCSTCHKTTAGTAPIMHGSMATKHNASAVPEALRCGGGTLGTDCHDITDVAKIHTYDAAGNDGNAEAQACLVACHKGSAQGSRPTATIDLRCNNAGCHNGAATAWWNDVSGATTATALDEHALHHNTQNVNRRDG